MAKQIEFTVITPERQVVAESADAVTIPALDGELGVLPQRAPLMCELGVGQLRYRKQGQTRRVYIDGGFAQVYDDHVTVLTPDAVPAEQISDAMIADAQARQANEPAGEARSRLARKVHVLRDLKRA